MYDILDPSKGSGRVAGYVFGILAGIIVIFGIVWLLIWLRSLVARRLGLDGDGRHRQARSVMQTKEEGNIVELDQDIK